MEKRLLFVLLMVVALGPIYGECFNPLRSKRSARNENPCSRLPDDEVDNYGLKFNSVSSTRTGDACDCPKKVGNGSVTKKRYYFNGESCEAFLYGGCDGNPNNFRTRRDCMKKCGHKLDIGSGEAEEESHLSISLAVQRKIFLEPTLSQTGIMVKTCLFIFLTIAALGPIYGDCSNLFRHKKSVGNENPCSLPPDSGLCYAAFQRYFYNSSSRNCETFIYGGCGGNENNFWTESQCEEACDETGKRSIESDSLFRVRLTSSSRTKDVCDYPKKAGKCYASKRRYYFNGETCEQFIYRGCGGNPNNFRRRKDCMDKCGHTFDIGSGEAEEENLLSVSLF